ncbi:MAG: N-methyl-L-tryptophan oxidase [Actinobacteria bacterium]|nr:N-methyl-L-tryptophan oxidase [Actinomycetota bacterium]
MGSREASGRYDVIVVGVGGMGSATTYHLAQRGRRVLGLERYDIPHGMGSSHGHTRIIRLAYYEDPSYVSLLRRAYELWRDLERRADQRLLHVTGSVDAGPPDSWVFKGSLQSCREHDLPHEVLTSAELTDRFPGYALPGDTLGVFQPDGGFLLPERCIASHVTAAHDEGAEIHARERVLEWEPSGDGVTVVSDRGVYRADRLVITAGAWEATLLPLLRGLAVAERQVLAWLQPSIPDHFVPDRFPVFNVIVDEGRFYGFPVFAVPGFKFGKYHHLQQSGEPDELDREPRREDEAMLREFAARHFPTGCGPVMALKTCLFTNSPDKHFIIDVHSDHPQVSFASPCSGHGFKFASVVGEVMADLAEHGDTRHDISLFRLHRLLARRHPDDRGTASPVEQAR